MNFIEDLEDKIKIEYIEPTDGTIIEPSDGTIIERPTEIVTENEFKLSKGYKFISDIKFEETRVTTTNQKSSMCSSRSVLSNIPEPQNCGSYLSSFQCQKCEFKTKHRSQLRKHLLRHGKKNFKCKECSKTFYTNPELTRHMKMNNDLRPFKCREKQQHAILRPESYDCDICGYKTKRRNHLRYHLLRHTGERKFQCKMCSKKFFTNPDVISHMKVHTGLKLFKCDICSWSFAEKGNLVQHIRLHAKKINPIVLPTYECYICGDAVKYKQERFLKTHMRLHIEKKHLCNICLEQFSYRKDLRKHLKSHLTNKSSNASTTTHPAAMKHQCSICKYSTKYSQHMKQHTRIHTGETPYECNLCPKKYKCSSHLNRHVRSSHIGAKLFKCTIKNCTKAYNEKVPLSRHIRKVHLGETIPNKYKCSICSLSIASKSNLKNHMRVHSGEKPFKCKVCFKSFTLKSNLDRHSIDVKCERNYECEICFKTFKQLNFLKTHSRSHEIVKYEGCNRHARSRGKLFECCHCKFKCLVHCLVGHMKIHGLSANCSVKISKIK